MAYDMTRCPQNETPEFRDYFYTLIQRAIGRDASDWHFVMTNSNIPPGFGPGVQADASYPLFGLTQQFSNGPKGRIFLPTDTPDENGYFTRCLQYLDDAAGTRAALAQRAKRHEAYSLLAEDFHNVRSGGLVWAWYWVAGHEYAPVQGAEDSGGGDKPPIIVAGGMTPAEVQAMIDTSLQPLTAQIADAVKLKDKIALRTNSGQILGIKGGGPPAPEIEITFISKTDIHSWESLTVEKGE